MNTSLKRDMNMKSLVLCFVMAALALAWLAEACCAVGFHGGGAVGGRGGGGFGGGGIGGGFGGGPGGFAGGGRGPSLGGLPGGFGGAGFGGGGLGGPGVGGAGAGGLGSFPRPSAGLGGGPSGLGVGSLDHGAMPSFPAAFGGGMPRAGAGLGGAGLGGAPGAAQLGNFLGLPAGGAGAGLAGGAARPAWPGPSSSADAGPLARTPNLAPGALPGAAGYAGNRPSWLQPGAQTGAGADAFASRLSGALPGVAGGGQAQDWLAAHPERAQQFQGIGDQVRQNWNGANHPLANAVTPGSDWWSKYHPNLDPWYYHHDWHNHGWAYWWGVPAWGSFATWFPTWGWGAPVYYDYGAGGNVVYQDQNVYVNGQDVGTQADYAASAADLATVPTDSAAQSPADNDWMALGTFAVETSSTDTSTSRVIQLAVDRQGVVSGTMHNSSTNQSYVVQGRVDKQTQRVAFTIGDKGDIVMETGIYNLTQQQTPVLVHFGPDKTETYYLVRLAPPDGAGAENGAGGAAPPNPFSP